MTEAVARDLGDQLFELYQGSFLGEGGEKSWALGLKDALRVRFMRALVATGRHYETQGQWERAVDVYERGLIVDPLAEGLYRQLMVCFENQNRKAEAICPARDIDKTIRRAGWSWNSVTLSRRYRRQNSKSSMF